MKHYNRRTQKYETRNELNNELYPYWWYDDINEFTYYGDPSGVHYEYLNIDYVEISHIRKGLRNKRTLQIDMMSIYSKEMLRQKKIDMILGDIQDLTNTIQNILLSKGIHL